MWGATVIEPTGWWDKMLGNQSYSIANNAQYAGNLNKHLNFNNLDYGSQQAILGGFQDMGQEWLKTATPEMLQAKASEVLGQQNSGIFSEGTDRYGNTTYGGATALQWGQMGLGALTGLYGMYQGNKQLKLSQQNFEEQKALNRANYKNQARAFNNTLRNQQSGRGYIGMSGAAKRSLGQEYNARKAEETY